MAVVPQQYQRRSPVYPRLISAGAEFRELAGAAVATAYPESPYPALGLADLSALPRTGVKGPQALAWLREQAWPVPDENNAAVTTGAGDLVLRLSDREALIASAPNAKGADIAVLEDGIPGSGVWHMPRRDSHCAFLLQGEDAVACLAKVCGVDFRDSHFAEGSIAQTSVARLNSIVCRCPGRRTPSFLLLADIATAIWFWDNLLDAMTEFGGAPMGIDELG